MNKPKRKTAIFETDDLATVERLARQHLNKPRVGKVGRLACVQSEEIEMMTEGNARAFAESFQLPLRAFRHVEEFDLLNTSPVRALAAAPEEKPAGTVIDVEATEKEAG